MKEHTLIEVGFCIVPDVKFQSDLHEGSFAEYVKADDVLLWSIPDETSYEDAVTLNVGTATVVQAAFHPDRLGLVEPPEKVTEETWVSNILFHVGVGLTVS